MGLVPPSAMAGCLLGRWTLQLTLNVIIYIHPVTPLVSLIIHAFILVVAHTDTQRPHLLAKFLCRVCSLIPKLITTPKVATPSIVNHTPLSAHI